MANQTWLAIRFVALPIEAIGEKYTDPQATIITEKNRVYALNQYARINGVQIGMSISQAKLISTLTTTSPLGISLYVFGLYLSK